MTHLYYVLTARCNQVCSICPRGNKKRDKDVAPDISIQALKKVLDENNITDITVSGGEPTLYPDLRSVIKMLDNNHINTAILSNSMKFSDIEFTRSIFSDVSDKSLFGVVTAIHSLNKLLHDEVTHVRGSFEKSVEGLNNLLTLGIDVSVKCIINKRNLHEIENYTAWVKDNIKSRVGLIFCGMDYVGIKPELIPNYQYDTLELKVCLERALDNALEIWGEDAYKLVSVGELPLCSTDPYYWKFFRPASNARHYYMDARSSKNIESQKDYGRYSSKCRRCKVYNYCNGVWRTQYETSGDQLMIPFV